MSETTIIVRLTKDNIDTALINGDRFLPEDDPDWAHLSVHHARLTRNGYEDAMIYMQDGTGEIVTKDILGLPSTVRIIRTQ